MKKVLSIVALALACVMLFAACQKEEQNTPTSTTPPAHQQTTETKPQENKPAEEPKVDPKAIVFFEKVVYNSNIFCGGAADT